MKTLIFDTSISGHHLEYLHHYYMGALLKDDEEYLIVVPKAFLDVCDKYEWPKTGHISFEFMSSEDETLLKEKNFYKLGWNASKILNKIVREKRPNRVLLTMMMQFIPFIIFLLPWNVAVRGIMYKIYLYEQEHMSWSRLLLEKLRFRIAVHSRIIEKIFVLNDLESSEKFNLLYKTNKFKYLPDPIPKVNINKLRDIRDELNIPLDNKIFLHFGSLDQRKGTIDILKAIESSSQEEMSGKTFIFAGKQRESLKREFYPILERINGKAKIIVIDEFCSYELLSNLCYTCDVILMPYHLTNLSSGTLGYAAVFEKPVIGSGQGLIGQLIKKYHLGITTDIPIQKDVFSKNMVYDKAGISQYAKKNTLKEFTHLILQ